MIKKSDLLLMTQTDEEIENLIVKFGYDINMAKDFIDMRDNLLEFNKLTREQAKEKYNQMVKDEFDALSNIGITF